MEPDKLRLAVRVNPGACSGFNFGFGSHRLYSFLRLLRLRVSTPQQLFVEAALGAERSIRTCFELGFDFHRKKLLSKKY